MASSRLTLALLVWLASSTASATVSADATALKICSAPSCVFRNGTLCDRTSQDCPRCILHDPLLGSPVCTGLQPGGLCLPNFTLCPETPVEPSGSAYDWIPLNTTSAPSTVAPTTRAPIQQAVANNVPLTSTSIVEAGAKHSFPMWTIGVMVAAAVVVVAVLFLVVRHRRKLAHTRQRESTLPVPPPFKDEDLRYECSTNPSSPHSFHSFDCMTIRPERPTKALSPPRRRDDRSPPSKHQQQSPDLEFSYGPNEYARPSSSDLDSGAILFTDSNRSVVYDDDVDVFLTRGRREHGDDDHRGSLGVDELIVETRVAAFDRHGSRLSDEDEDVDIYPDTAVTRLSGAGRMFSPKTTRTLAMTNFTTFSIDDQESATTNRDAAIADEYPDTSVVQRIRPPSTAARSSAALALDVVDVWDSHRTAAPHKAELQRHERVAEWKRKYGGQP